MFNRRRGILVAFYGACSYTDLNMVNFESGFYK